jgi:hypothetical protein
VRQAALRVECGFKLHFFPSVTWCALRVCARRLWARRSHPLVDWSRAVKHDAGPKVLRQTFSSFGLTSTQAAPTVATLGVSTAPTASTAAASARPTAEAGWSVHYSSRSLLEAGATAAAAADDRLSVSSGSFSNSTTPQTASRSRVSAFSTTSSPESPTHDRLTRSSRLWAPLSAAAPLLEGVTPVDDSDDERDLSLVTPPRLVGTASLRHGGMVGVSTFGVSTFGGAWSSRGSATLSAAAAAADSALPVPRCTRSFADLASLACDPGFGGAADDVGGDGLGLDVDWGGDGEQDMGTLAAPLLRGGVGPDLGADSRTFEVRESSSSISSASDADVHGPVIVPGLSVNATVDAPAPSGDLGLDKDAEGDACFPSDAPVVTIGRGFGSGSMPVVCGRPNSPSMVWEPLKRLFVPRLSVDSDEGTALMLEAASRASSSDGALSSAAASSRAGASSAVATASSVWGASSAVPSPRTQAKTNGTKGRVTVTAPVTLGLQTVFGACVRARVRVCLRVRVCVALLRARWSVSLSLRVRVTTTSVCCGAQTRRWTTCTPWESVWAQATLVKCSLRRPCWMAPRLPSSV